MTNEIYYENKLVGLLIGYYRNIYGVNDKKNYTQKKFISYKSENVAKSCLNCSKKCAGRDQICSLQTIQRIEKGEIIKNVCYYIDLASKLGLVYDINRKYNNQINNIIRITVDAYNDNNLIRLKDVLKETEYLLLMLNNHLYYAEMLRIIQAVINYRLYAVFPSLELIKLSEFLVDHLNCEVRQLIYILLHEYYIYYLSNKEKASVYLNKTLKINSEYLEYKLKNYSEKMTPAEMIEYINHIDLNYVSDFNRYSLYHKKAQAFLNLSLNSEALQYINKCIDLIISNPDEFPKLELIKSYCRRGVIYYQLKMYEHAYTDFKQVITEDINRMLFNFILFVDVLEKTNRYTEKKEYINHTLYKQIINSNLKIIYKYYQMRESAKTKDEFKQLSEYIIESLRPLIPSDIIYYPILLRDLIYYCDQTSAYRYVRDFVNYDLTD